MSIHLLIILAFSQEEDEKSFGLQTAVDPTIELRFSAKFKTKGRPPGAKNKKLSITQADLEGFTHRDLSRFEYEAKTKEVGIRG